MSPARVLETGELVWFDPNLLNGVLILIVGVRFEHNYLRFWLVE